MTATIGPGAPGRRLVLAERADGGWVATLDGRRLAPAVHAGWAQAFELPPGGGRLVVEHRGALAGGVGAAQLAVAVLALLLAAPLPRRRLPAAPAAGPDQAGRGAPPAPSTCATGRRPGHLAGAGRPGGPPAGRSEAAAAAPEARAERGGGHVRLAPPGRVLAAVVAVGAAGGIGAAVSATPAARPANPVAHRLPLSIGTPDLTCPGPETLLVPDGARAVRPTATPRSR